MVIINIRKTHSREIMESKIEMAMMMSYTNEFHLYIKLEKKLTRAK